MEEGCGGGFEDHEDCWMARESAEQGGMERHHEGGQSPPGAVEPWNERIDIISKTFIQLQLKPGIHSNILKSNRKSCRLFFKKTHLPLTW